jgi:hypothetical protein
VTYLEGIFNGFIALCNGISNPTSLVDMNRIGTKFARGDDIKSFLSDRDKGKMRIYKLLCQAGSFLMTATGLIENKDSDGACMAIIAAGNCARAFNFSTLNPVKQGSVLAEIAKNRAVFTHPFDPSYDVKIFQELVINTAMSKYVSIFDSYTARFYKPN